MKFPGALPPPHQHLKRPVDQYQRVAEDVEGSEFGPLGYQLPERVDQVQLNHPDERLLLEPSKAVTNIPMTGVAEDERTFVLDGLDHPGLVRRDAVVEGAAQGHGRTIDHFRDAVDRSLNVFEGAAGLTRETRTVDFFDKPFL